MFTLFVSLFFSVPTFFRPRLALQAEILALRHQLLVLQRSSRGHKLRLGSADRALWVWLSRLWTAWRCALIIVRPETVIGGIDRDSGCMGDGRAALPQAAHLVDTIFVSTKTILRNYPHSGETAVD
jgi:hypothetical protein